MFNINISLTELFITLVINLCFQITLDGVFLCIYIYIYIYSLLMFMLNCIFKDYC